MSLFGGEIHFLRKRLAEKLFLRVFGSWHTGARIRAFHIFRIGSEYLKPGCHILDAGCGLGRHAFFIARKYPKVHIIGVDMDNENISICNRIREKNGCKNVRFHIGDLRYLNLKGDFDLIICSDVLEYIKEDHMVLANFKKLLKKDGRLILHTPRLNPKRLLGVFGSYLNGDGSEKFAHVREGYSEAELREKLRKNGLKIMNLRYTFGSLGSLSWEISKILERVKPLFVVCFPLILSLAFMDTLKTHKEGNGILVETQRA
jgi:2-polyprenyl-3-methyl-5-hydroxy-6-metoxy-1,4-benzoquinol methylase